MSKISDWPVGNNQASTDATGVTGLYAYWGDDILNPIKAATTRDDVVGNTSEIAEGWPGSGRSSQAGSMWRNYQTPANSNARAIAWSPELGIFVVSYQGGTNAAQSNDGRVWTRDSRAELDNGANSIAWSRELNIFCAIRSGGTSFRNHIFNNNFASEGTLSSANGVAWISVCWSSELGLFCGVSSTGTVNRSATSSDGITWALGSIPLNTWRMVCWSPELGLFCAVANTGTGNRVVTSPNGSTWTARSIPDYNWESICWSREQNMFVVLGDSLGLDRIATSPDGITWTLGELPVASNWWGLCWARELGIFAGFGLNGSIITSTDGFSWTRRRQSGGGLSAAYSPELRRICAATNTGTNHINVSG